MRNVPHGWWPSPLRAEDAAASRTAPASPLSDGPWLYWLEARPQEQGRVALLRARRGEPAHEVTPPGTSVRSRVHEYGGGAYCPLPGERVAWVDAVDQRVYSAPADGSAPAHALSPAAPAGERHHHGDLRAGAAGGVLAVRERHCDGAVTRDIVRYGEGGGAPAVLAAGHDFFAAPRPSTDGRALAYVAWDHPDMQWDASALWMAEPDGGGAVRVAGGDGVSVGQPWWADDATVVFACDADGWWQPWCATRDGGAVRLCDARAEFHGPDWALGQATMAPVGPDRVACRYRSDGIDRLGMLEPAAPTRPDGPRLLVEWPQPCTTIGAVVAHDGGVLCLGRTEEAPATLWWAPVEARPDRVQLGAFEPFGAPPPVLVPPDRLSRPEAFRCDGPEGRTVHGLFLAPCGGDVTAASGERPPLLVFCHGGPTGSAEAGFDVTVQFFATRGFAVALVDYAGSTGYGRAFRESLYGRWGEADSDDCVAAAAHLSETGRVDRARMAIRGSSAGGMTALNALVRSSAFAAAASWYGVTDLLGLEATTHDFESSYNHRLIGPLPGSEDRYRRRSPVNRVDDMTGAVLLLYGLDDPVVPASQARDMAAALRRRGVDCEEEAFEGEGHGFRRAETVRRCLEAELDFYRRVLVGTGASPP